MSIDINEKNIRYTQEILQSLFSKEIIDYHAAKKEFTAINLIIGDSVKKIFQIPESIKFDLIYLDSMDVTRETCFESSFHHLKELAGLMKNLKSGSVIVVDDYNAFFDEYKNGIKRGKGMYVKEYFDQVGLAPIYCDYQLVYQLP